MTTTQAPETVERITEGAHVLQLYEHTPGLAAAVSRFLAQALRGGEAVIVIATAEHRAAFEEALVGADLQVPALTSSGVYVALDADEVLAKLMLGALPDAERFEAVIGACVERAQTAAPTGRVSAYGELVDLLWRTERLDAAMKLEALWGELMKRTRLTLMCGYAMQLLSSHLDADALIRTCQAHSHALLAHDRGRLETAVKHALVAVVGADAAEALRFLITNTFHAGGPLGFAERTIVWLRRNLPKQCDAVLDEARRCYAEV